MPGVEEVQFCLFIFGSTVLSEVERGSFMEEVTSEQKYEGGDQAMWISGRSLSRGNCQNKGSEVRLHVVHLRKSKEVGGME